MKRLIYAVEAAEVLNNLLGISYEMLVDVFEKIPSRESEQYNKGWSDGYEKGREEKKTMIINGKFYSEPELRCYITRFESENAELKRLLALAIEKLELSEIEDFNHCEICEHFNKLNDDCEEGYECFFRWEYSNEAEKLIGGDKKC